MIQVRMCEEKDVVLLKKMLGANLNHQLICNNIMVIEESKTIYGLSSYKVINSDFDNPEAEIDILYIDRNQRLNYFGDSLIKATLNLLDLRGIKKVYIESRPEDNGFFEKVKLKKESENRYSTQLPDFFDTACRSKG